jgi:hypothetical protein
MSRTVYNMGDTVLCDLCNDDYTGSIESGGAIVGSYGVCPKCWPGYKAGLEKYRETHAIRALCPDVQSFADFVREYRGGDGIVTIESW